MEELHYGRSNYSHARTAEITGEGLPTSLGSNRGRDPQSQLNEPNDFPIMAKGSFRAYLEQYNQLEGNVKQIRGHRGRTRPQDAGTFG